MLFLEPLFGFTASTSALTILVILLGHVGRRRCGMSVGHEDR
jgi:hypothetical protein